MSTQCEMTKPPWNFPRIEGEWPRPDSLPIVQDCAPWKPASCHKTRPPFLNLIGTVPSLATCGEADRLNVPGRSLNFSATRLQVNFFITDCYNKYNGLWLRPHPPALLISAEYSSDFAFQPYLFLNQSPAVRKSRSPGKSKWSRQFIPHRARECWSQTEKYHPLGTHMGKWFAGRSNGEGESPGRSSHLEKRRNFPAPQNHQQCGREFLFSFSINPTPCYWIRFRYVGGKIWLMVLNI